MDDVDSVQASISRTMLRTGNWVTPHLDGIKYFEKPPLKYWMIAIVFKLFGHSDSCARLPMAICAILLCWLTARMGAWAFNRKNGTACGRGDRHVARTVSIHRVSYLRCGADINHCAGDVVLLKGARFRGARNPRGLGPYCYGASVGTGILFKGLIAAVFPLAAGFLYLCFSHQVTRAGNVATPDVRCGACRLRLAIAAPWHVLATIRNPPYLYCRFHSGPGEYHGFFWLYFFNEHILRFLNRRYPRDYNTVPRLLFWLLHLAWFFPWSVYFPGWLKLRYRGSDRASRMRLMALCWIGFVMVFFSFSSTQEYYSMPCYPAIAILLACAVASHDAWIYKWLRRCDVLLATHAHSPRALLPSSWPACGDCRLRAISRTR